MKSFLIQIKMEFAKWFGLTRFNSCKLWFYADSDTAANLGEESSSGEVIGPDTASGLRLH